MKSLVDVIIPVYGCFDLLSECVESIPEAFGDIPHRVMVWDNKSPVGEDQQFKSSQEVRDFYTDLRQSGLIYRFYMSDQNIGFGMANNKAVQKFVRREGTPLVLFLNSDVVLYPNAGRRLVETMDDPEVGVVGAKLLFPKESSHVDQNEQIRPPGKIQHVGLSMHIGGDSHHVFLGWDEDHPRPNALSDIFAVTGACMMTRTQLFHEVGGFDAETYGLGTWEDIDYCLTVTVLGRKIKVNVEAVGTHHTGASSTSGNVPFPLEINRTLFLAKWQHSGHVQWTDYRYY